MNKNIMKEIIDVEMIKNVKPSDHSSLQRIECIGGRKDNDRVKAVMLSELLEIGLSRKVACRILNIKGGTTK